MPRGHDIDIFSLAVQMLILGGFLGLVLRHERRRSLNVWFRTSPRAEGGKGGRKDLMCRGRRGDTGLIAAGGYEHLHILPS